MMNRRQWAHMILLLACGSVAGCAAPRVSATTSPLESGQDCCQPPPDSTVFDYYFDPITGTVAGPPRVAQNQRVRVVVYNVNPLLFEYRITEQAVVTEEGSPRDFLAWWLGKGPNLPALWEARQPAVRREERETPSTVEEGQCDRLESDFIVADSTELAIASAYRMLQSKLGDLQGDLERRAGVLLAANTRGKEWNRTMVGAAGVADDAAKLSEQFVVTWRVSVSGLTVTTASLKARYNDSNPRCPLGHQIALLDANARVHQAAIGALEEGVPELTELARRYRDMSNDASVQYSVRTLSRSSRPSNVTITVARRRQEEGAVFNDVASAIVNVGGEPRFHIGGGFIVAGPIESSEYATAPRNIFDPATGTMVDRRVIVATAEEEVRVVPMVTLTTNFSARPWDSWGQRFFLSIGTGLDTSSGGVTTGYYLGLGHWFGRDLSLQIGGYVGERSRLGRGQAVGDLVGEDGAPTIDKTLKPTFGAGLFYRIR